MSTRFATTRLSNFLGDTTNFTNIAGTSINGRSQERKAVMKGKADEAIADLDAAASRLVTEQQARQVEAGGMAQGAGYRWSGFSAGVEAAVGGLGNMGGGGTGTDPFRDPNFTNEVSTNDYNVALGHINNGGMSYWDSSMPVSTSVLR